MLSPPSLALLCALSAASAHALSCTDSAGSAVDWWAGIKANDGTAFAAYDHSGSFSVKEDMAKADSHPARTMQQIYGGSLSSVSYVMYNDEEPNGKKSESRGHTKGVVAFDDESGKGFWLIHSIPRWPPVQADGYNMPLDEQKYGQSFICVTLDASNLNAAAQLMQYNYPQVYDSSFTSSAKSTLSSLFGLSSGNHSSASDGTQQSLRSAGGSEFRQFAKTKGWGKAIGEYLISPYYRTGFQWETWRDGTGDLQPWCAGKMGCQYDTFDVTGVKLPSGQTWAVTQDHSKWGISTSGSKVACIGDINRQSGQFKRGGGFLCKTDTGLWNAFNQVTVGVNSTCTAC